jgi:hypothetical protein
MGERAFAPGTPEAKLDEVPTQPVWVEGTRAKIGSLALTNDRILFVKDVGGAGGAGLVESLLAAPGEMAAQATERAQAVVPLAQVSGGRVVPRRLVADLYEFTLADDSTCRVGKHLGERWEPTIHRLLTERHQRSVVSEGTTGWRVA